MTQEVVIDVNPSLITIGLLEDGKLAEYQRESQNATFSVGNIYLGRVKKLMPGLNAAFVDVGSEKEGFLHYQDLGLRFRTSARYVKQQISDHKHIIPVERFKIEAELSKMETITDVLTVGQEILVQVSKEPISTKGPRLTGDLSLPGRFMVLLPFQDTVSVSAKIKSPEERTRLKDIIKPVLPNNYGLIVRTSANGVGADELRKELASLVKRWESCVSTLMKGKLPILCYEDSNRATALIRDIFNPSFENIWVNDPATFNQIKEYVSLIAPEKAGVVHLYEDETPILDKYAVTRQIKSSMSKTVSCKAGAYIIIEHTEAMHVIDVNSGHRSRMAEDQEENAMLVNMAAAEEIARQLRLRDMGGIVVVDFIDIHTTEHREELWKHMRDAMSNDRAKHSVLPLSKFCVMQITRQRVRPVSEVQTAESCPVCGGKHVVKPSIIFPDILEEKLSMLVNYMKVKKFSLYVHPFIAAAIRQGWFFTSRYWKWKFRFGFFGWKLIPDQSMELLQYRVVDSERNEIDLSQPIDAHV